MTDAEIVAAYALLMAAILLRDVAGAMPRDAFQSMPDDIRNRMLTPLYQEAFNRLPVDVQAAARAMVETDPDVTNAKQIHISGAN